MSQASIVRETERFRKSLRKTLDYADHEDYSGNSKHDAFDSSPVKDLTFNRKWLRILAIQTFLSSLINLPSLSEIMKYLNPKGIAFLSRGYMNLYKIEKCPGDLQVAFNLRD
jgi:hypothetical protein